MSLTIPTALATAMAEDVTRARYLFTIERRDGTTIRLTDHEEDLVVGGNTYSAGAVVGVTDHEAGDRLAVSQMEVTGALGSAISLADLRAGLFARARVTVAFCVHDDVAAGLAILHRGFVAATKPKDGEVVGIEVEGLRAALQTQLMPLHQVQCPRALGDAGCGVPLDPGVVAREAAYSLGAFVKVATGGGAGYLAYENRIYEVTAAGTTAASAPTFDTTVGNETTDGTVTFTAREAWTRGATVDSVTDEWRFSITVTEARAASDDTWFLGGIVVIESGDAAGAAVEVQDWDAATQTVTLFQPLPATPANGDRLRIAPGCDKSLATCRDRFDNVLNHLGDPYVPGQDWLLDVPGANG